MRIPAVVLAMAVSGGALGCSPVLIGRTTTNNPLATEGHISEGIVIPIKDPQIIAGDPQAVAPVSNLFQTNSFVSNGTPNGHTADGQNLFAATGGSYHEPTFYETAFFEAQTSGHLVFLVELCHRIPELTLAESYDVTLTDDEGHVYRPAHLQQRAAKVAGGGMQLGRTNVVSQVVHIGDKRGGGREGDARTFIFTHSELGSETPSMKTARMLIDFEGGPMLTTKTRQLALNFAGKHHSLRFVWDIASR